MNKMYILTNFIRQISMNINILSVNFSSVANIKNLYKVFTIVYGIYYSVISNFNTVKHCIVQFLTTIRPWLTYKRGKFWLNVILDLRGQFFRKTGTDTVFWISA